MSEFAYVGFVACGCRVSAVIDNPERREDVAEWVADCLKNGQRVERIPLEDVQELFHPCEEHEGVSIAKLQRIWESVA